MEKAPAIVPETAKQVGKTTPPWAWVEPSVWTDRMLAALVTGVKGGKWYSLMDKVYTRANLQAAFKQVKRNQGAAGVDHQTIEMFEAKLTEHLNQLGIQLKDGTYQPQAVRRVTIPKPGSKEGRPLGVPSVRDRVAEAALLNVIEPIFEVEFTQHSYGFRPNRGCKDALRRVDNQLRSGLQYVVDADLKSYFDTIPHRELLDQIKGRIADGRIIDLIANYLQQGIQEGMKYWQPESGSAQGSVISPLLSNVYLHPLDQLMAAEGFEMTRYADDLVVLCRTEAEAKAALACLQAWVTKAGLVLHPDKTKIVNTLDPNSGGFEFLGYYFHNGQKRPRRKSLRKFKDAVRRKTRRQNGCSMEETIADLNPLLRGWFEYFKHSHKWTFNSLDGWIRMRLRSILRRRRRRRGRGRGADHQRWPNAYFRNLGLYSLATAHAEACQSSAR
jgi:RNA-directed DNA polymerase